MSILWLGAIYGVGVILASMVIALVRDEIDEEPIVLDGFAAVMWPVIVVIAAPVLFLHGIAILGRWLVKRRRHA